MKPNPEASTALRIVLVALAAVLGLGSLGLRAQFHPPLPSVTELLWLTAPALLAASAAWSLPDRRGALWLLAGLLLAVAFTTVIAVRHAQVPITNGTSSLLPTFLPLWQIGLPVLLWVLAWGIGKRRHPLPRP